MTKNFLMLGISAETFIEKFLMSPKGSYSFFFNVLQQTGFSKSPKNPPLTILKTLRFLSLRYSAVFRGTRLV